MSHGEIELEEPSGSARLGRDSELHVTLRVNDSRFFRAAVTGGTLSVAESYLRGDWDCDDLTSLFRIFIRNRDRADRLDRGLARVVGVWHRLLHWWRANTRAGSRSNIRAHYDLGNDFFRLWLDETLAYSCGIFPSPGATMYDASVEKFDRVCRKLDLRPTDHVLEIGSGWGGFAIHAAANYGCRVTTTTISNEQFEVARARVEQEGLSDRVSLLKEDYRDLSGRFDKLVSIEMIEAVGHKNLDAYFRKCGELLAPDGSMLLQAIVMPERRYAAVSAIGRFHSALRLPWGVPAVSGCDARIRRADDRPTASRCRRLCSALCRDAATLAARVRRTARSSARPWLSDGVHPAVELLSVLL